MIAMLSITTPIFLLIAVGFFAVKWKLVTPEAIQGFGRFVLFFGLPALLFQAISSLEIEEVFNGGYVLGYALGSILAFILGLIFNRALNPTFPSALAGMGVSLSNNGFVGYPLMLLTFTSPPAAEFAMVLLVENLLILPLAIAGLEYGNSRGEGKRGMALWRSLVLRVVSSPLFVAILAGAMTSALHLPIPQVLDKSLAMLAGAAPPIALFVIGGSLVGASLKGAGLHSASIVAGKLVLHPVLVALSLALMPGVSHQLWVTGVLFAAMPMASMFSLMGGAHGQQEPCSAITLLATVLAFFTLSFALAVLI